MGRERERTLIDFAGQTAIVTGAGRGLGRLFALDLARRGARVVVNDIGGSVQGEGTDAAPADEVVEEIRAAGGAAVASYDSVATPEGGAAIVHTAVDTYGRLDAVIANAGIYEMLAFEDLTLGQWNRMLEVHLDGAFHVGQPAYRVMKDQGYGRIVLLASNVAAFGQAHATHYGAAKGGILGLCNSLANEGAAYGIGVNVVMPCALTRMLASTLGGFTPPPAFEEFLTVATPERVVPLATYLASRDCDVSHHAFSAVAGRYARVFIGVTDGWLADRATVATAEDVAAHFDQVCATDDYSIPLDTAAELDPVMHRLGII